MSVASVASKISTLHGCPDLGKGWQCNYAAVKVCKLT